MRYELGIQYAKDVVSGDIIACKDIISACQRFLDDLERVAVLLRLEMEVIQG